MSVPVHHLRQLRHLDREAERRSDRHRRALLDESDQLLSEIEELRLARITHLPPLLRLRMRRLQTGMGRPEAAGPYTVRSAHHLIFAMQQRLMAANPRRPTSASLGGRPPGTPLVSPIRPGLTWKLLTLPADPGAGREQAWTLAIDLTIERALDRWAYAQHHAVRAARRSEGLAPALARARVAWNNYWELVEEAARIRRARLVT